MILRRANARDVDEIADVRSAAIRGIPPGSYAAAELEAWSARKDPASYRVDEHELHVVVDGGVVVAYGELDGGTVRSVYVAPDRGGRGLGTLLLAKLEEIARERGVRELRLEASLNAAPYYRRRGFAEVRRGSVVSGGMEMAYVEMRKPL